MSSARRWVMPILFVSALLGGCAEAPREAGFPDVRQAVAERASLRVQWHQGAAEDKAVAAEIESMLSQPLTPEQAVQIALLNNRRLQATYEDLGVAQATVVQAGLLSNPVFDFGAGFIVGGGQTELTFGVTQSFLDVLYRPLRQAVAEADFEAAKLRVSGAVLDLAAQTRAAFYRAQADEQLLEMRRQVADATSASYDAARRLHEAGNIRDLDLHQEKTLHDQARLDLAMAEAAVFDSRERLNRLMGLWGAQTQWALTPRLPPIPDQPPDLDGLETRAIASSLDLAMARQEMESVGRQLGLTKATAWASFVDLGVEAEREEGDWEVGPHVALPIPLFDQGQARVAAAQAELRRRRQAYYATAVEVRSAVRAARQRLLTAQHVAVFYRDQVLPLSEQVVRQTLLEYNAMQLGVFQLLQAKRQQIDAGQRYIEALHAYWVARTELDAILQGRATDFGPSAASLTTTSPGTPGMTADQGGH